ncbi:hypothetical protein FEO87_05755 [Stenotrophomonas maltophilia]|nr:hypothetical protein FEO87_05755 [Stenotrophomonas maltophilia]
MPAADSTWLLPNWPPSWPGGAVPPPPLPPSLPPPPPPPPPAAAAPRPTAARPPHHQPEMPVSEVQRTWSVSLQVSDALSAMAGTGASRQVEISRASGVRARGEERMWGGGGSRGRAHPASPFACRTCNLYESAVASVVAIVIDAG